MLTRVLNTREWFVWNGPTLPKELRGVPGIRVQGMKFLVHRTHLPLLEGAEGLLTRADSSPEIWAARNERMPEGFELRTTQQQAIDFITARRGTLLGDDMRLGKTLTAIMSHDPSTGPLVIFAPLNTRGMWLGWLRRVFPGVPIGTLFGRKFDERVLDKPIIFGHYDVLQAWQKQFPIGTFVLDEAHLVGNEKTKRTKAALFHAQQAHRVIAMTGTPVWNLPPNLWSILAMITPGGWGGSYDFCMRYGLPVHTGYGTEFTGISCEDELRARLSEVMLRRRWMDVADDVPPISRSVLVASIDDATRRRLDIIAAKLKSERTNTAGNIAHYRAELASIKSKTVLDEVNKTLGRDEPIVVWTWHKEAAEQINTALGERSFMIHGDISAMKRDDIIAAWKETRACALVSTMSVANVGLDFSHARLALFAELDYIPAVIAQAEMRTFDPKRPMDVRFVVADHFVDQRLVRALVTKLGAANPLGVGAAIDAIEALRDAVLGPQQEADMDRLLEDLLAAA